MTRCTFLKTLLGICAAPAVLAKAVPPKPVKTGERLFVHRGPAQAVNSTEMQDINAFFAEQARPFREEIEHRQYLETVYGHDMLDSHPLRYEIK